MMPDELRALLEAVRAGSVTVAEASERIGDDRGFLDLGDAKLDTDRRRRRGFSEVIYCASKTAPQVAMIARALLEREGRAFGTRCDPAVAGAVLEELPGGTYDAVARILRYGGPHPLFTDVRTAVVAAGTSDIPVAEEAALTLEAFGAPTDRVYDVGVAGLHRLLAQHTVLSGAGILIVAAGMEGALPSVVGGLYAQPLIAVPTSVGYGTALGGFTALFGMLTSCASGIMVVNVDNGFGAAMAALSILKLLAAGPPTG